LTESSLSSQLGDLIRAYLGARRAWEIDAEQRFEAGEREGMLDEQVAEIQRQYRTILERYFTRDVAHGPRSGSFGTPPSTDPDQVAFGEIHVEGDRAVVSTSEFDLGPEGHRDYEYVLEQTDGDWRIADRRGRDHRRRWISGIF
jgi:hypothetical protein